MLIVTGARGRIGRLLRQFESSAEFNSFSMAWASRSGQDGDLAWNMTGDAQPDLPDRAILLHLAAVLPGRGGSADLRQNADMARAILQADRRKPFAHVVFLSTVAVYAPQSGAIAETCQPDPQSDYGRAKLDAEMILRAGLGSRLTILRLANLAGADALLGGLAGQGAVTLDPVPGQPAGPIRSYIGPLTLARCLGQLMQLLADGRPLPAVLNLAQPGPVAMGALLAVSGREWHFGPERAGVVARVEVDVSQLLSFCDLKPADAAGILAELDQIREVWP